MLTAGAVGPEREWSGQGGGVRIRGWLNGLPGEGAAASVSRNNKAHASLADNVTRPMPLLMTSAFFLLS